MSGRDKLRELGRGFGTGLLLSGFISLRYLMGSRAAWDACRAVAKAAAP